MKTLRSVQTFIFDIVLAAGVVIAGNTYLITHEATPVRTFLVPIAWVIIVVSMLSPYQPVPGVMSTRLRILRNGLNMLYIFCLSFVVSLILSIVMWTGNTTLPSLRQEPLLWVFNTLILALVLTLVFFAGMIRVYLSSEQLALKWRIIGIAVGFLPIVNLIMMFKIIGVVSKELDYENRRLIVNAQRKPEQLCKTRYPLLLVHGVFFRDFKYLNYWGRIPDALTENGATIYYGEHQSAASVADCGVELAKRIETIVKETGCEKLNVIAHSKGGLDTRYALSKCGADKYVASLTTINTPHRGCEFADYLLNKIPKKEQQLIAQKYNSTFKSLGDEHPDFLKAVNDLTHSACERFNEEIKDIPGILYKSVGSKLNRGTGGRFPLNMSYLLVKYFDGDNDGLVGKEAFPWGSDFTYLTVKGLRGISHGDMIDLNRENIPEFDVREFYINLVHDLKEAGL